jgi:hypothetical protein
MASAPTVLNTSCNLLITGINASMFYEMNIHSFDSQYSNVESNWTSCPFPQAFCCQNEYDDNRTPNSSTNSKHKFKLLRAALIWPRIRDNYKPSFHRTALVCRTNTTSSTQILTLPCQLSESTYLKVPSMKIEKIKKC